MTPPAQAVRNLRPALIAIDGPAASGKSTVGFAVAEQSGFLFFDTGAMYRAVTWAALDRGFDVADLDAVGELASAIRIDVRPPAADENDGRHCTVLVDGEDVTWQIRAPGVDRAVSTVSANGAVRIALTAQQRRIGLTTETGEEAGEAEWAGVVMVGRDIGTVVMPDAPLKIYLDASAEARAQRRCLEQQAQGKAVEYSQVLEAILRRDQLDSERALSPLRVAADAVVIDTSALSPQQVVEQIFAAAESRLHLN
ncbi:MAG: (d)CMP kinase [Caldilineaceae bacterium]|nr:(d)CMP kinase [Caldilineaceae bacterium]